MLTVSDNTGPLKLSLEQKLTYPTSQRAKKRAGSVHLQPSMPFLNRHLGVPFPVSQTFIAAVFIRPPACNRCLSACALPRI